MDVHRFGQIVRVQKILDQQPMENTDSQTLPIDAAIRSQLRHLCTSSVVNPRDDPSLVLRCEKPDRALLVFGGNLLPDHFCQIATLASDSRIKALANFRDQLVAAEFRNAPEQSMSRQDNHARIAHADVHHQHVIRRMIVWKIALFCQSRMVVTCRLVTMMAVGHISRLGIHDGFEVGDRLDVCDWPHTMHDSQMIGSFERCGIRGDPLEQVANLVGFVRKYTKDLAEIRLAS